MNRPDVLDALSRDVSSRLDEFTYIMSGASLMTSRTESQISQGQFARALELWPADGPGALGSSVGRRTYMWALLNDQRILGGAAE